MKSKLIYFGLMVGFVWLSGFAGGRGCQLEAVISLWGASLCFAMLGKNRREHG